MVERIAHAKINLALHVTGQRADGYHLLDSIVAFTEYGDHVSVGKPDHPHGPVEVAVSGPFSEGLSCGADNLVTSAALLLREAVKRAGNEPEPVSIHLTKNLPVASGMGGGSADAAATLLALQDFWHSDVDLLPITKSLGADVTMCLRSLPLRARGIGDEIALFSEATSLAMVLVNPNVEVSTPAVFNALSHRHREAISDGELEQFPSIPDLCALCNDLETPAIGISPQINSVLAALHETDAKLARMSGSGATCFGLYTDMDAAEIACAKITDAYPNWWCIATRTTDA